MRYSLWLLKDHFSQLVSGIECRNHQCEIEDFRLYEPGAPAEEHTMLIGRSHDLFQHGDKRVVFRHGKDRLVLDTEDLTGVMNRFLSLHRFYSDWEEQCRKTISQGQSLQSLLDLGEKCAWSASADRGRLPIPACPFFRTLQLR